MVQSAIHSRSGNYAGTHASQRPDYAPNAYAVCGTLGIAFGLMLIAASSAYFNKAMLPFPQKMTLSDQIESGTIAGKVVINSTAYDVSVAFSADHDTTLTALKDAILDLNDEFEEGLEPISDVEISGNEIKIIAEEDNEVYFKTFTATSLEIEYDIATCWLGASKRKSKERNQDGTVYLENTEDFDCIKQGEWWIVTEETSINPAVDKPFVRIVPETSKQVGALKKSADSGKAVPCTEIKFVSGVVDGKVAVSFNI